MSDPTPESPESLAFGRTIRAERGARELTQRGLGDKADVSSRHLSEIERGKVDVRLSKIVSLAQGLEMHLGELMTKVDERLGRR